MEKSETAFGFGVSHTRPLMGATEELGCRERFGGTHRSENKSLPSDSPRKEAQRQKDRQGRGSLSLAPVEWQREGSETSQRMCGVWGQSGREPEPVCQALQRWPDPGDPSVGSWPPSTPPGSTGMLQQCLSVERMNTVLTNSPRLSLPASGQLMRGS